MIPSIPDPPAAEASPEAAVAAEDPAPQGAAVATASKQKASRIRAVITRKKITQRVLHQVKYPLLFSAAVFVLPILNRNQFIVLSIPHKPSDKISP